VLPTKQKQIYVSNTIQLPQRERYEDEMIAEQVRFPRERLAQDETRGGHAGAGGAEYLFAKYLFDVRSAAARVGWSPCRECSKCADSSEAEEAAASASIAAIAF
jgi:hypothetical protein